MKRIAVLMATAFVDMIGFAIVMPLLPFYARDFQAPYWMIGWLIAVFAVMQLISAPLWGRFSDRFGRRPAILLGLCVSVVAYAFFAFADSVAFLLITRLVQGVGGGTTPVLQAYVADSTAPRDRAKALGWLSAATSAGVMVGPVIGSFSFGFGGLLGITKMSGSAGGFTTMIRGTPSKGCSKDAFVMASRTKKANNGPPNMHATNSVHRLHWNQRIFCRWSIIPRPVRSWKEIAPTRMIIETRTKENGPLTVIDIYCSCEHNSVRR